MIIKVIYDIIEPWGAHQAAAPLVAAAVISDVAVVAHAFSAVAVGAEIRDAIVNVIHSENMLTTKFVLLQQKKALLDIPHKTCKGKILKELRTKIKARTEYPK